MRILTAILLAVCLLLAGHVAADLRTSDNASAGTTWQVEYFGGTMSGASDELLEMEALIESLSADCQVDVELATDTTGVLAIVAYSCPD